MKKEKIVAVLKNPRGRGKHRHWRAFIFNTDIQSHVEAFMHDIHIRNDEYFLMFESDLEVSKKEYGIPHLFYTSRLEKGRHIVFATNVKFKFNEGGHRSFLIE